MIDIPVLWQFMIILATHFVADFLLQTHWQASNKSKNNVALLEHVAVYTATLAVVSVVLFGFGAMWFVFCWINAVLHYCTDYCTSRWSARHFRLAMESTERRESAFDMYGIRGHPLPDWAPVSDIDPAKHWHNFFVVIGLDQLIHQITLAITLWLIVA